MKKILSFIILIATISWPTNGLSQVGQSSQSTSSSLSLSPELSRLVADFQAASLKQSRVILNDWDKQDWSDLEEEDLPTHDERIMRFLKYATDLDDDQLGPVIVDRIRRGYSKPDEQTTRIVKDATYTTPQSEGKVAMLAAIGTTSCYRETVFPRELVPTTPIWIHWQTGEADQATARWPFGRSFDRLTRQSLWLSGRGLTRHPVVASTWSEWLELVAKAEIEARFGLTAGSLSRVTIEQLPDRIAELRLAHDLGLADLPAGFTEETISQQLGQWQLEELLNLPRHSLTEGPTHDWRGLYQQIGRRVLEEELSLPESAPLAVETRANAGQPTSEPDNQLTSELGDQPTDWLPTEVKTQIGEALAARSTLYTDPRIGLGLPPNDWLPVDEIGTDFLMQLGNGSPDAYAALGAYYLAESLGLNNEVTVQLIRTLYTGQNIAPDLATARPIDAAVRTYFASQNEQADRATVMTRLGRSSLATIKKNLGRLNETVLLAITGSNKEPTYSQILTILTDSARRQTVLNKIATGSLADANYYQDLASLTPALTKTNLQKRGRELTSQLLSLPVAQLEKLEKGEFDLGKQGELFTKIEDDMGWSAGLAQDLMRRNPAETPSPATLQLQDRTLVTAGAQRLWERLRLPLDLQERLNQYYFIGDIPLKPNQLEGPTDPIPIETPVDLPDEGLGDGEAVTDELDTTSNESDESTDTDGSDDEEDGVVEFVDPDNFSIAVEHEPTQRALQRTLNIPEADTYAFFNGQWWPALLRASLAILGQELSFSTTITSEKLVSAYNSLSPSAIEPLADQGQKTTELTIVRPNLFPDLYRAAREKNKGAIQKILNDEALYQWNLDCTNKRSLAEQSIDRFVNAAIKLPSPDELPTPATGEDKSNQPTRPNQVLLLDMNILSSETRKEIKEAYEDEADRNDGVKGDRNKLRRLYDRVLVGY